MFVFVFTLTCVWVLKNQVKGGGRTFLKINKIQRKLRHSFRFIKIEKNRKRNDTSLSPYKRDKSLENQLHSTKVPPL